MNNMLKILCSIPVIILFLYFIPFLGICLMLFRGIKYNNKKNLLPIVLIVIAILILIPKVGYSIFDIINFDTDKIPYLKDIVDNELYSVKLIGFSKFILTVGIVFLILSSIFEKIFNKFKNFIRSYINNEEQKKAEIYQKNDMIMQEKREKAKNTHVVYCPYCGADNILTSNTGTCKYCRREITGKN